MARSLRAAGWDTVGIDTKLGQHHDCRKVLADSTVHWDLAVHCAALVNGRETIENRAAVLAAYNLQLDGAMWEWALRARPGRVVYFSSSAAYPIGFQGARSLYGDLKEDYVDPANQNKPLLQPDASYGWTKLVGERVAAEVRKAGVPVTVVRPFSGYGEDQDDCYPFPAMIARAKHGDDPFQVWGDGRQVRDFVHVDDIVGAILSLIEQGVDGPVNIGTGVPTSMDELAGICMREAGYEAPIEHLNAKPRGVAYRVADTKLLRRYYAPKVSLAEGVRRALA
jgi:nucleoside-diphosphate-sugar epimerase